MMAIAFIKHCNGIGLMLPTYALHWCCKLRILGRYMSRRLNLIFAAALSVRNEQPIRQRTMSRKIACLFAFLALTFGNMLMVPDVHAAETGGIVHAADHIYEHGAEHFDEGNPDSSENGVGHQPVHHHNCSFAAPGSYKADAIVYSRKTSLRAQLADSPLASRAPPVLIQPPKP